MEFPKEYVEAYREGVQYLKQRYQELGSYQKVANALPGHVHRSSVYKAINSDWIPKYGALADALNLPKLTETLKVIHCEDCGEILTSFHECVEREPVSTSGSERPSRIRIDLDPDMPLEDAEKVRNLSRETRTRVLVMAAEVINR